LSSGNACYHSVLVILSSCLLCKIVNIIMYITIFSVIRYACETWSLVLKEGHRMRVFENTAALRRMFGPKRNEVPGG
jgi:hypothetical protein